MSPVARNVDATAVIAQSDSARYARMVKASKRLHWEIDADVLRGRRFDPASKFLPDALSHANELAFLATDERRRLTHVQARTYASVFAALERVIAAEVLQLSSRHRFGDPHALEALVRFADEELKHQELFRRIDTMMAAGMPPGYTPIADPDAFARMALGKSTWSLLALTIHSELLVQSHCAQSMDADATLSPLWKDIFIYHWQEECQHVVLDELEWTYEDRTLTPGRRDAAVDDLIELMTELDRLLQAQAEADSRYFSDSATCRYTPAECREIEVVLLRAYRWQYILCGVQHPHFSRLITSLTTPEQRRRIEAALANPVTRAAPGSRTGQS